MWWAPIIRPFLTTIDVFHDLVQREKAEVFGDHRGAYPHLRDTSAGKVSRNLQALLSQKKGFRCFVVKINYHNALQKLNLPTQKQKQKPEIHSG